MNFTTDVWSSPNHWAFVAFCMHLEHKGKPLSMPLDIVKVTSVSHILYLRKQLMVNKMTIVTYWS